MATLYGAPALSQDDFNRLAQINREQTPFIWMRDGNKNNKIDPKELAVRAGYIKGDYVKNKEFTPQFKSAYLTLVEMKRRETIEETHAAAIDVRVETDFSDVIPEEKEMIRHIVNVAQMIEDLYHEQLGTKQYDGQVAYLETAHPESYKMYQRYHGPFCEAKNPEDNEFCNALPSFPKEQVGVYPPTAQTDQAFCESIKTGELGDPMTVLVQGVNTAYDAVFYHEYYKTQMAAIAQELELAAKSIQNVSDEKIMYSYLMATADSFRTGYWLESDRIWVSMNMHNSKYALRVAPDESYWEPCQGKAGFELWFGRVNKEAAETLDVYSAMKGELEQEVAKLTPYYKAEPKEIDVPDFVDIALTNGDTRHPVGGVAGQALPNWTYEENGFRKNIFLGIGSAPEHIAMYRQQAEMMLHPASFAYYTDDQSYVNKHVAGHEITHSIGAGRDSNIVDPETGAYKKDPVTGEPISAKEALGSQYRSTLEELRAETGSLFFAGIFLEKNMISENDYRKEIVKEFMWCLKHYSYGMLEADGRPKTYSQVAAAIVHHLMKENVVTFTDGKFNIDFVNYHEAITKLFKDVSHYQLTGDRDAVAGIFEPILDGEDGYNAIQAAYVTEQFSTLPNFSYQFEITGV
ncbi:hypothetical protein KJ708_04100 [bacterium]|nr:hypothetical protein [bacterium]MBU1917540.1 hypothetical protein [bacterium]